MLRGDCGNHRLILLKQFSLASLIECDNFPKFLIDFLIIAPLIFSFLNSFSQPLNKLMVFGIVCCINSKLVLFFAVPKFLRRYPFGYSYAGMKMLLIVIIIIFLVFAEKSCISVFVQQVAVKLIILKHKLSA